MHSSSVGFLQDKQEESTTPILVYSQCIHNSLKKIWWDMKWVRINRDIENEMSENQERDRKWTTVASCDADHNPQWL